MYFNGSFSYFRPKSIAADLNNLTGKNVKVAVIDSGWAQHLNDIRIIKGKGFVDPDDELDLKISDCTDDQNGHGSACVDLMLRVAPDITILPLKVFGTHIETSVNMLEEAFRYAIDNEVDIINMSLGTTLDEALIPLYRLCEEAKNKNIITIAAQSNTHNKSYPAIFENVISVITTNDIHYLQIKKLNDEVNEYSALGIMNDILKASGDRNSSGGNSFAAPIITGLVALVKQKNPHWGIDEIRTALNTYAENFNV